MPCKIIETEGNTEDEKTEFSLAIAKAANTQKPIKSVDLKANSKEQVRFANSMREVGIFYQTKRGEEVPAAFRVAYLNSSLVEIGKLCMSAIYQVPGVSRNKPSYLYQPKYYDKVFDGNQMQIAKLSKELLYIDYYFKNVFQKKYDRENANQPDANDRISFAHNARTICIAFVAFASRYYYGTISDNDLNTIFAAACTESASDSRLYNIFSNIDNVKYFIPPEIFNDKDRYDNVLYKLFNVIIETGITSYMMALQYDPSLSATNYLKKDKNYYTILKMNWWIISASIKNIFDELR